MKATVSPAFARACALLAGLLCFWRICFGALPSIWILVPLLLMPLVINNWYLVHEMDFGLLDRQLLQEISDELPSKQQLWYPLPPSKSQRTF